MLMLWLLAWHLIKKETESLRTVFAQGQQLKWWQNGKLRQKALVRDSRLVRGTDCMSHSSDQHKQFWSHFINFASSNSHFNAAHWQFFLLCCDFPTPPPQIISFFWVRKKHYLKRFSAFTPLRSFWLALSFVQLLGSFLEEHKCLTEMQNTRLAFLISIHTHITRSLLDDKQPQA